MHPARLHPVRVTFIARRVIALALAASTLVLAASAFAAKPMQVRLTATGHKPKVGAKWTAIVKAQSGSGAAAGAVSLDVLFGGNVVAHVSAGELYHGAYRKTVHWPVRAVGYKLTLRARVTSRGAHHDQFYAFRVLK